MAVSQELLEILRCPYCVSGETRKPGDDPGQMELVRDGQWLGGVAGSVRARVPERDGVARSSVIQTASGEE